MKVWPLFVIFLLLPVIVAAKVYIIENRVTSIGSGGGSSDGCSTQIIDVYNLGAGNDTWAFDDGIPGNGTIHWEG
jgi:hypothetical protein